MRDNYLYHFGIKGMRWGRRKPKEKSGFAKKAIKTTAIITAAAIGSYGVYKIKKEPSINIGRSVVNSYLLKQTTSTARIIGSNNKAAVKILKNNIPKSKGSISLKDIRDNPNTKRAIKVGKFVAKTFLFGMKVSL